MGFKIRATLSKQNLERNRKLYYIPILNLRTKKKQRPSKIFIVEKTTNF